MPNQVNIRLTHFFVFLLNLRILAMLNVVSRIKPQMLNPPEGTQLLITTEEAQSLCCTPTLVEQKI